MNVYKDMVKRKGKMASMVTLPLSRPPRLITCIVEGNRMNISLKMRSILY